MLRRILFGCMSLLLPVGFSSAAEPTPAADTVPAGKVLLDFYGDPLPPGAVARLGSVRLRHAADLLDAAFSPDGKWLCSLACDNTLRLWDTRTGSEVYGTAYEAEPTAQYVETLAVSPDSRRIAVGGYKAVKVFDLGTREWRLLAAFEHMVMALAFAPDDKALAVADGERVVVVDSRTGERLRRWNAGQKAVRWISYAPDGTFLATVGEDRRVRLWDPAKGREAGELKEDSHPIATAVTSPDGRFAATGGRDNSVWLWDVAGQTVRFKLLAGQGRIDEHDEPPAMAFAPDGRYLVAWDGRVLAKRHGLVYRLQVFETATGKEVACLQEEGLRRFRRLTFSPDGQILAGLNFQDDRLWLWKASRGRAFRPVRLQAKSPGEKGRWIYAVLCTPDGKTIVGAGEEQAILRWDTETGEAKGQLPCPKYTWLRGCSPDGRMVATTGKGNAICLRDLGTGEEKLSLQGAAPSVSQVVFTEDGQAVVSADFDGVIRVWDAKTGKVLRELKNPVRGVTRLALSPGGKLLATSDVRHVHPPPGTKPLVRLWDMASGQEIRALEGHSGSVSSLMFSPDGKLLVSADDRERTFLWDVASGKEIRRLEAEAAAFLPDGKALITSSHDDDVRLWEVATGRLLDWLDWEYASVRDMSFSRDGKRIALALHGIPKAYERIEGLNLERVDSPGHSGHVTAVRFSPEGEFVATAGVDMTVRIWDARTGRECRRWTDIYKRPDAIGFLPDKRLWAYTEVHQVLLWNWAEGRSEPTPDWLTRGGISAAFSCDGSEVFLSDFDSARILDAASGRERLKLENTEKGYWQLPVYSADGKFLAAWHIDNKGDGGIQVWETATGRQRLATQPEGNPTLALSADGRRLAVSIWHGRGPGEVGEVVVWDTCRQTPIQRFRMSEGAHPAAFSPDGLALALCGGRSTVRVVDLWTMRDVVGLRGTSGGVTCVAFSPDGQSVAAGSSCHNSLVWSLPRVLGVEAVQNANLDEEVLARWWEDMGGADAPIAHRAAWRFACAGAPVVAFLKARLPPAPDAGPLVRQLLPRLDHEDHDVRAKATEELAELGESAETALREALKGDLSTEARARVRHLLAACEEPVVHSPEKLRRLRAAAVLWRIGTSAAHEALEVLAKGVAEARETREAAALLARWRKP